MQGKHKAKAVSSSRMQWKHKAKTVSYIDIRMPSGSSLPFPEVYA